MNARAEEVGSKVNYKRFWLQQQLCIVPAQAVFEPNWESEIHERWAVKMANGVMERCYQVGLIRFTINGLSSGETAFALLFSALEGGIQRLSKLRTIHNLMVLIDEGEMFMHPKWQREYIRLLIDFFARLPHANKVHLMLSTHSLVVAADTPAHALYNVQSGRYTNGFGLGPKRILTDVYGVNTFHGEVSEPQLEQLEKSLAMPNIDHHIRQDIERIVASLADVQVAEYLKTKLDAIQERPERDQN